MTTAGRQAGGRFTRLIRRRRSHCASDHDTRSRAELEETIDSTPGDGGFIHHRNPVHMMQTMTLVTVRSEMSHLPRMATCIQRIRSYGH
jgi:hypothetical protein